VFTIGHRRTPSRERRKLAQKVRRYSREEHERYHRAGVIQLGTLAARSALYDRITALLEDPESDPSPQGLDDLRLLLSEVPPVRDYGPRAGERNDRIASILAQLEVT
jgi:hypothetical protein